MKTIAEAAEAIRSGRDLEAKSAFDFAQERANRPPRFIEIINDYKNGTPVDKIANDYSCSRTTVQRYARIAGLPNRPKGVDNSIRTQAIELYRTGLTAKKISKMLNVSEAYVSNAIKDAGIARRNKTTESIIEAHINGLSTVEIIKKFKTSRAKIYRVLKSNEKTL